MGDAAMSVLPRRAGNMSAMDSIFAVHDLKNGPSNEPFLTYHLARGCLHESIDTAGLSVSFIAVNRCVHELVAANCRVLARPTSASAPHVVERANSSAPLDEVPKSGKKKGKCPLLSDTLLSHICLFLQPHALRTSRAPSGSSRTSSSLQPSARRPPTSGALSSTIQWPL
jgi:hypothetical protein